MRSTNPAIEINATYAHSRISSAAEIHSARLSTPSTLASSPPAASTRNRHNSVAPLSSSTRLSAPNAVSSTLRAAMPATMASNASAAIQATVNPSSRTPRRIAPDRTAASLMVKAPPGPIRWSPSLRVVAVIGDE